MTTCGPYYVLGRFPAIIRSLLNSLGIYLKIAPRWPEASRGEANPRSARMTKRL